MPIPQEHNNRYVYHMTHLDNLESILNNGLLSTNEKTRLGIEHENIANQSIQHRRASMSVPCGPGGVVHDYVPFYFCPREPMLLSLLNSKNLDQHLIVYLAVSINVVERENVVFTSSSANTDSPPIFYHDPDQLTNLSWELIDSKKWSFQNDAEKQSKMAEMLICEKVDITDISYIVIWNDYIKKQVTDILSRTKSDIETKYEGYELSGHRINHYFCKFFTKGEECHSLITGPELLCGQYEEVVKYVKKKHKDKICDPKFHDISDAISKIARDFSVIPELNEIKDLETLNTIHWQTIGDHSKNVAGKLLKLQEYATFNTSQKNILTLAAYLHDIGKGTSPKDPKSGKQKIDNDHAANAIPMLKRILSEDFENLTRKEIRQIVMLVVYHDLIGEIVGKGRDRKQILYVIKTMDDFDMLVAISKADVASLISGNPIGDDIDDSHEWLQRIVEETPDLRQWVESKLEVQSD